MYCVTQSVKPTDKSQQSKKSLTIWSWPKASKVRARERKGERKIKSLLLHEAIVLNCSFNLFIWHHIIKRIVCLSVWLSAFWRISLLECLFPPWMPPTSMNASSLLECIFPPWIPQPSLNALCLIQILSLRRPYIIACWIIYSWISW